MSSIVNLVNSDTNLKKCDQMSVIASCMVAATMDFTQLIKILDMLG